MLSRVELEELIARLVQRALSKIQRALSKIQRALSKRQDPSSESGACKGDHLWIMQCSFSHLAARPGGMMGIIAPFPVVGASSAVRHVEWGKPMP